jgi:hypothetical protein
MVSLLELVLLVMLKAFANSALLESSEKSQHFFVRVNSDVELSVCFDPKRNEAEFVVSFSENLENENLVIRKNLSKSGNLRNDGAGDCEGL